MFCVDLQAGYQQVRVSERVKKLQGGKVWLSKEMIEELMELKLMRRREVAAEGEEVYVRSGVLTFGNKRSVPIFTLLTRQVLRLWRSRGWRVGHLLDDFMFAVKGDFELALQIMRQAIHDLEELGWLVNYEKSILWPTKVMKWIGIVIDSRLMRLFVSPEKVLEGIMKAFVEENDDTGMRELAGIAGQLSAMGVALIPMRMALRELFALIKPAEWEEKWEARFPKREEMKQHMLFWMRAEDGGAGNLRLWNQVGSAINPDLRAVHVEATIDAGKCVGYKLQGVQHQMVREVSMPHRATAGEEHVHREVDALVATIAKEGANLANLRVLAKVDASATVQAVRKGVSSSVVIQEKVNELWELVLRWGITLRLEHISGSEMVALGVDGLSRIHEWRLAHRVKQKLMTMRGKPTLDMWSSPKLKQLPRYCCIGGGEDSVGDARSTPLTGEMVWAVPPVTMVEYTLKRMKQEKAKGIVVAPLWKTQAYYAWRFHAVAEWVCPWEEQRPVVVCSDGDRHCLNKHQFVAWLFDFSDAGQVNKPGPPLGVGTRPVMMELGVSKRSQQARSHKNKRAVGITVLSIFDGIGCGLLALQRAGFVVKAYWVIEIDEWCLHVTQEQEGVRLCEEGNVRKVRGDEVGEQWPVWADIDLVIFGFPCQDVSRANTGAGPERKEIRVVLRCATNMEKGAKPEQKGAADGRMRRKVEHTGPLGICG